MHKCLGEEKRNLESCGGAHVSTRITSRHTWVALPATLINSRIEMKHLLLTTIAAVVLVGCAHYPQSNPNNYKPLYKSINVIPNGVPVESGPVYEGQQKLLSAFVKAFTDGDAEGCAKLYTEDTIYMQAELPIEKGRDVVLDGYQKYFKSRKNKIIEVSEPIKEVISFGNMAVIRGTGKNVEETPEGVQIIKTYKYMILSEKQ